MDSTTILSLITIVITWLLGIFSKRSTFINNNIIPLQNLLIGFSVALIEWLITNDFKASVAVSGLLAGGTYDLVRNLYKIKKGS